MLAVLLDYPVANGQTQAGALADRLGGVERVKDVREMFWCNPHTVVLEVNLNLVV
jgi:hypothetical protein